MVFIPNEAFAAVSQNINMVPESFSALADSASPAVVNIRTESTTGEGGRVYQHFFNQPFGQNDPLNEFFENFFNSPHQREYKHRSLGSGFIFDDEGYIVTNNHVVENADEISVKLKDGQEFSAERVGTDPKTDLALLKIKAEGKLPSLELGDSDSLKIGEWVVAIGSPFGLEQTVTAGIVSAKGRVIGAGPYDDFIQTDASINPGNSGGPLLNLKGQVIGINTAIVASGQGIGFAIPANMAKNIINQLKQNGSVTRGWLGVAIQPVSKEMAEYYQLQDNQGALVTDVFPGDPADKAGLKPQDIILTVNGKKVTESRDLSALIADIPVGEKIPIEFMRDGKRKTVTATIAKREETDVSRQGESGKPETALGITVANITDDIARKLGVSSSGGVFISEVVRGSKGDMAGLSPGDIIIEINHKKIIDIKAFQAVIADIDEGNPLQMIVRKRNGTILIVTMTK
ncbi:MAG: DegQ family serine endoprotease [Thermodesulfobacteriota bacterium]